MTFIFTMYPLLRSVADLCVLDGDSIKMSDRFSISALHSICMNIAMMLPWDCASNRYGRPMRFSFYEYCFT